jgi:hypothetical protein
MILALFGIPRSLGVFILAAHEIGPAGLLHLLGGLFQIIHPHPEMDQAIVRFAGRHARHIAGELEQRNVDGAVAHVKSDAGLAGALHAERLLEELGCLLGIGDRKGDVTQPRNH